MTILERLNKIIEKVGIPVETGIFSGVPPDEYIVLTPLVDTFPIYGDNKPIAEVSEVRISLFCKGNYMRRKSEITAALLESNFTITGRRFVGYEAENRYYNYAIDVAGMEE